MASGPEGAGGDIEGPNLLPAAIKRKKLSNDEKNSNTTAVTSSDENTNTAVSTSSDKDKEAIACEVMEAASYL